MPDLAQAFRAHLATQAGPELDAALHLVRDAADAAWPALRVPVLRFGEHLATLVKDEADVVAALARLRAADVYFTLACADNLGDALAVLERVYFAQLHAPLSRMGLTASAIDETLQVMRDELLVAREGMAPRILSYGGRGQLVGWLRAVAGRTGLRTFRHPQRNHELDERVDNPTEGDLELEYMKKSYGEVFQRAFRAALDGISEEDRLLLKQRFRHHLTVEELGAMHSVNAGTISRWVAAARERLVKATRSTMMAELGVGREDVESILRMIHSELEISLSSVGRP